MKIKYEVYWRNYSSKQSVNIGFFIDYWKGIDFERGGRTMKFYAVREETKTQKKGESKMDTMGDVKRVTVTLPNGKSQIFKISAESRVYPIGSTQYWTMDQFNTALAKMRDAGAKIEEETL